MRKKIIWVAIVALSLNTFGFSQGYTAAVTHTVWESLDVGGNRMNKLFPNGTIIDAGAIFNTESDFPKNPTQGAAVYRFDYKIKQHIHNNMYQGNFVYYINSKDGSFAFSANENPGLINANGGPSAAGMEFHFLIKKASGGVIVCGTRQGKKEGYEMGGEIGGNQWFSNALNTQIAWLERAAPVRGSDAANSVQWDLLENMQVKGLRGEVPQETGSSITMDVYLSKQPVQITVSVPFMGFGVGIFKNYKLKINQLAVASVMHDVNWGDGRTTTMSNTLLGLYEATALFKPGEYTLINAFTKEGMEEGESLTDLMKRNAERLQQLSKERSNCPKGNNGKSCREEIDAKIEALQEKMKAKAMNYLQKNNLDIGN